MAVLEMRAANKFAQEQHELDARMRALLDKAEQEGRGLTDAENGEYRKLEDALDASIDKAQKAAQLAAAREKLDERRALTAKLAEDETRNRRNPMQLPARMSGGQGAQGGGRDERRSLSQMYNEDGWPTAIDSPEYRSLFADVLRCRRNAESVHADFPELRTLTLATSNVAVPTIMANRIVEILQPLSPLFSWLPKIPAPEIGSVPVETGAGTAAWVADGSAVSLGDPSQTLKPVNIKTLGTGVAVSRATIDANAYPLEEYLSRKLATRLRNGFELGALRGTNTGNEPNGLLTELAANFSSQIFTGGAVGSVAANDFIDCEWKVSAEYRTGANLRWLISDAALKEVRKLKDTTGQYLWKLADAADLRLGIPGTINGYPYFISGYFEAAATTKIHSVLGNWDYFECHMRNSMDLFVDPYTSSASRVVNYYGWMRCQFLLTIGTAFGAIKYT